MVIQLAQIPSFECAAKFYVLQRLKHTNTDDDRCALLQHAQTAMLALRVPVSQQVCLWALQEPAEYIVNRRSLSPASSTTMSLRAATSNNTRYQLTTRKLHATLRWKASHSMHAGPRMVQRLLTMLLTRGCFNKQNSWQWTERAENHYLPDLHDTSLSLPLCPRTLDHCHPLGCRGNRTSHVPAPSLHSLTKAIAIWKALQRPSCLAWLRASPLATHLCWRRSRTPRRWRRA